MFTLVTLEDDIPVMPADFGENFQEILKRLIQRKYVDKVIPQVGLCIEFYDFISFHEAMVYPGDGKSACGEAYHKVEFRLVIFRPVVDEWLVGSIADCSEKGLVISLGFFEAVEIPSANLRTPYTYDPHQKLWVWQYVNPETQEVINFFYEKDELIRFRVMSLEFDEGKLPTKGQKTNPMRIVGAVDFDGLGCVAWWPDCREDIAEQEQREKLEAEAKAAAAKTEAKEEETGEGMGEAAEKEGVGQEGAAEAEKKENKGEEKEAEQKEEKEEGEQQPSEKKREAAAAAPGEGKPKRKRKTKVLA